jgi:hypothetical protein
MSASRLCGTFWTRQRHVVHQDRDHPLPALDSALQDGRVLGPYEWALEVAPREDQHPVPALEDPPVQLVHQHVPGTDLPGVQEHLETPLVEVLSERLHPLGPVPAGVGEEDVVVAVGHGTSSEYSRTAVSLPCFGGRFRPCGACSREGGRRVRGVRAGGGRAPAGLSPGWGPVLPSHPEDRTGHGVSNSDSTEGSAPRRARTLRRRLAVAATTPAECGLRAAAGPNPRTRRGGLSSSEPPR